MVEINDGGLIDNTTIVFMVDLSKYSYASDNENYSASLIYLGIEKSEDTSNIGSISDVNLYGALRNINSNTTDEDGNIVDDARNTGSGSLPIRYVYMLSSSAYSSDNIEAVTSYMTIQGNNAKANDFIVTDNVNGENNVDGASVSVIFDINSNIIASNSYVILGDGANGSNGADGIRGSVNSNNAESGDNGGNGGKAGYVIVSGDNTPTIYQGTDGVGGNGGNGADGNNVTLNDNHTVVSLSRGGGGGGAYGLDAKYYYRNNVGQNVGQTIYGLDADSILSNRRQASGSNNIDSTSISALGGSGGSGGLGLIYYNEAGAEIVEAFNDGEGRNSGTTFYPGSSENPTSYYLTAAGGGSAGLRLNGVAIKGSNGSPGDYYSGRSGGSANYTSVFRGTGESWWWDWLNFIIPAKDDENTNARYSYYWSDNHWYYADEFLFGNLQFIPVFSHWYLARLNGVSPKEIPAGYSEIMNTYGSFVPYGDNAHITIYGYGFYLSNYIKASDALRELDNNSWKEIFYGGKGGTYSNPALNAYFNMIGGTPYTREIYGFQVYTPSAVGGAGASVYDKFFFSRNDMVTSAGQYGTAQGVSAPNYNQ